MHGALGRKLLELFAQRWRGIDVDLAGHLEDGAVADRPGILLNRENDTPLDGLGELIVALHDIGEVLKRPPLARLARIAQAAEQVTGPPL